MAGITRDDVDVTGCYDAFTYSALLQFEDYGFCGKGKGKNYVSGGAIRLGGRRPNNTSGAQLCEGYTHGMNMVIENVRQLRVRWTTTARTGGMGSIPTTTPRAGAAR